MIESSISGYLPKIRTDATPLMERIKDEVLLRSILGNFMAGGRPNSWQPKRNGWPSFLYKTGALRNSIQGSSGENWAKAGTSKGACMYALIHNFGGVINNAFGKGIQIVMPERRFVMFQEYDKETILKMATGYFVEFNEPVKIPQ